jgi:protein TonB
MMHRLGLLLAFLLGPLLLSAEQAGPKRAPVFTGGYIEEKEANEPPRETRHVQPKYPVAMLRAGIEGWVIVAFVIDLDGQPTEVQAIQGSRVEFEVAAVDAARQWRFTPGRQAGKPVRVAVQRRVEFRLEE